MRVVEYSTHPVTTTHLLRWPAPDAGAEGGDVDDRVILGVEGDSLDIPKGQPVQGLPRLSRVFAQPQAAILAILGQTHINPVRFAGVDRGAEALRVLARDPGPGNTAVNCLVVAALLVVGIRRAEVDDPAVTRIDIVILGPEQGMGPID